jgi:hypothetical protein
LRKIEFRRWLHRGIWACGHMVSAPAPRRGGGGGGGGGGCATDDAGGGACGIDASKHAVRVRVPESTPQTRLGSRQNPFQETRAEIGLTAMVVVVLMACMVQV